MGEERRKFHLHDDDLPEEALQDCMKPPEQPILVHCIHCGEEYDSWRMIWVPFTDEEWAQDRKSGLKGFWCCPIEGCTGAGFTMDIWPADPDYVDPETGESYWCEDEPLVEGHDPECECAECEMAWHEIEAEFDREVEKREHEPLRDEDIPF